MNHSPRFPTRYENLTWFFGALGIALLGLFFYSPFREKGFDDVVTVSHQEIDFGVVPCTETVHGQFSLTNRTNHTIPFRISADCSCASVEPSMGEIEPNSKKMIEVRYRPKSQTVLDSSRHQESTDLTVSIRDDKRTWEQWVRLRAETLLPAAAQGMRISVEPYKRSEVAFAAEVAFDVEDVRLVSSPEFIENLEFVREGSQLTFLGFVDQPPGIHRGELSAEFVVRGVDTPVSLAFSVWVVVEKPYDLGNYVLEFQKNTERFLQVEPRFGVQRVEFVELEAENDYLETVIQESDPSVVRLSTKKSFFESDQDSSTGVLRVVLRVSDPLIGSTTYSDSLSFVISKGGGDGDD
ncbi:DUF1573 domain-containing protein [Pirellulaceae bacterium SH449]